MPLTRIRQTAIGNRSITSAKLAEDLDFDGDFVRIPHGTTAERPASPVNGYLRYNTSFERLEQYADGIWQSIDTPPSITTLTYPSPLTAVDPAGGESITLTGTNFQAGATVSISGTASPTVTVNSSTSITFTTPAKTAGDYDVVVTNPNGLAATLTSGITYNGVPAFTTAANLGDIAGSTSISNLTIVASETDGGTIAYSISTPASPDFVSINSGTGVLSGTTPAAGSANTNYSFTVTATDDENQTNTRTYTLTVLRKTYGYSIPTSLTFTDDDEQYLYRTQGTPTDGTRWTWSGWVKRSIATASPTYIFTSWQGTNTDRIGITSADRLHVEFKDGASTVLELQSDILFRDTDSWYHITVLFDSNLTQNDRVRAYVNGQAVTWSYSQYLTTSAYTTKGFNANGKTCVIGGYDGGVPSNPPVNRWDGKIAEVHFIDGTAVAPTNFGETYNGLWVPKQVSGLTYGTNGFYIPFRNESIEGFNSMLYRGNGWSTSAGQDITGFGFKPDLVIIKNFDQNGYNNWALDSVRGSTNKLITNMSNGQGAEVSGVISFDDDGFTLGNNNEVNYNNDRHGVFGWEAGGGTTSTNTEGDINSTVSVNDTYGFSIVQFTSTSTSAQAIGHGLGGQPHFIIAKKYNTSENWRVFHKDMAGTDTFTVADNLHLNTSDGYPPNSGPATRISTVASADTFTFINSAGSGDYIAYCWRPISGYSHFGKYSATGGTQTISGLGFKPAFILQKRLNSSGWYWISDAMDGGGPVYNTSPGLQTNGPASTAANGIEFTNDGFIENGYMNDSGQTVLYMAFADTSSYKFWRDYSSNASNHFKIIETGADEISFDTPTGNY